MSERGSGFGTFLLGVGVGAVLGFLFAPEPGMASRTKLSRKLRDLRDLATEKAGELGELMDAADEKITSISSAPPDSTVLACFAHDASRRANAASSRSRRSLVSCHTARYACPTTGSSPGSRAARSRRTSKTIFLSWRARCRSTCCSP